MGHHKYTIISSILGAIAFPLGIPRVLAALGFTHVGIAAHSLASYMQSVLYGGKTCCLFSTLQRMGMKGLSVLENVFAAESGGGVGAVASERMESGHNDTAHERSK